MRRQVVDCIDGSSIARPLPGGMAGSMLPVYGRVCRTAEFGEEFDGCMYMSYTILYILATYAQIMHGTKHVIKADVQCVHYGIVLHCVWSRAMSNAALLIRDQAIRPDSSTYDSRVHA